MNVDQKLISWLRLIRSDNVGPVTFWQLMQRFGGADKALEAIPEISSKLPRKIELVDESLVHQELEKAQKLGVKIIPAYDPGYPAPLDPIGDAPPILYVLGNTEVFKRQSVGIVGARNSSLVARRHAEQMARDLSRSGYAIASGLARGIDRHAHMGSLEGGTIAVLAGGVDMLYPPEHKDLYDKIQDTGCIVSEMPLGLYPGATHFPRRNRIISGLSVGVVIVEAAHKSGSLITARYAQEQGREIFAVPGSPLDPRCQGTNDLIRKGAHLVQHSGDILEVLQSPVTISHIPEKAPQPKIVSAKDYKPEESFHRKIMEDLSFTPVGIDLLVQQYNRTVQEIMSVLLELELTGLIVRFANGTVALQREGDVGY